MSEYWEDVRDQYAAFETTMKSGSSEVWLHEMPGGQFTNLKAQARSLGLEERWHEVAQTYADVNQMFGDIVKVTPSSKVVGDMALLMVSQGLTRAQVEDPDVDVSFPDSVVDMMRGETASTERPGAHLPPVDLEATRAELSAQLDGMEIDDEDLNGYLMYPKVFMDYMGRHQEYGPVRILPTNVYFYGMEPGQEIQPELDPGKTLIIRLQAIGETNEDGDVRVFFEINGQPRVIRVANRKAVASVAKRPKAELGNADHVAAPMPGVIASVAVTVGQEVAEGDMLLTIEAMKMETAIHADRAGTIAAIHAPAGSQVDAKDLLIAFE